MAVNKVEYGDEVLIDLTDDTVYEDVLLYGVTAHTANGEVITGRVDLQNYYTKAETDALIPDTSNLATTGYVNQEIGKLDFSPYALKTEIPNTTGLATEKFVTDAIEESAPNLDLYAKKSEIPPLNGYATQAYVGEQIAANKDDLSIYALKTEIPSTSGLATTSYVDGEITEVMNVANGKTATYIFDTVAALDTDLAKADFKAKLNKGDVFLIKALNVPDYWWDGSGKSVLETTKCDLTNYALKTEIPTALSQLSADSTHRLVTDSEKTAWNNKSNFNGDYNSLNNKPTIPAAANKGYSGYIFTGGDGVAEMGKYIDFHATSNDSSDFSLRFTCPAVSNVGVTLPSISGTLPVGDKQYKIVVSSSTPTTTDTSIITFVV